MQIANCRRSWLDGVDRARLRGRCRSTVTISVGTFGASAKPRCGARGLIRGGAGRAEPGADEASSADNFSASAFFSYVPGIKAVTLPPDLEHFASEAAAAGR